MKDVGVVSFLNPFVDPQRVEVFFDWDEKWPKKDPFANASFTMVSDAAGFTPVTLEPILIPEIAEQLVADGLGTNYSKIDELAPGFVEKVATAVSDTTTLQAAFRAQSLEELKAPTATVLASPNYSADLQLWARTLPPQERAGRGPTSVTSSPPSPNLFLNAVHSLVAAVGTGVEKDSGLIATQAFASQTKSDDVDQLLRQPEAFRSLVTRAIESKAITMPALKQLEEQIRIRTLQEQLAYAEALRRDEAYTRDRLKREEAPMISAATNAAAEKVAKQRGDIRRLSADEPVLGAMFHVIRWFHMPTPAALANLAGKRMRVEVTNAGPIDGEVVTFKSAWTLVAKDGQRFVTVLRRDTDPHRQLDPSYLAHCVQVRQIAPALSDAVEDVTAIADSDESAVARLSTFIETRHSAVPVTFALAKLHGAGAAAINNAAETPKGGAAEELEDDKDRKLRDAAESLRRHHPPHDSIGITWERDLTVRSITGESLPPLDADLHLGFKGYRIDVREDRDGKWQSLCTLERAGISSDGEEVFRTRRSREGFISQPVQNCSSSRDQATMLTIPADFVQWAGGSAVLGSPLDRLGKGLPADPDQYPLVALSEQGTTKIHPRYGHKYEFRVRGVGLTGVGPLGAEPQTAGAGSDSIDFKRGVPMEAPKADGNYVDLERITLKGNKGDTSGSTPDIPLLVIGDHPSLQVRTSLPIAHWRVALHSRGCAQAECETNGGPAFHEAISKFVARSRDNWTRRQNGTIDPMAEKQSQYLSAIDPDCAGIEIVSRVWFPFSSNTAPGRQLITGRYRRHRDDIEDACFSELVARGEKIINDDTFDDRFEIPVVRESLPANATEHEHPRILGGFHCTAEVAGYWSHHAKKLYAGETGRRRWTRHFFAGFKSLQPIGGTISGLDDGPFAAGGAPLITGTRYIDSQYAGLRDVEQERHLIAPNQPPAGTGASDCEAKSHGPVRVEAVRWRKFFFDRDCSASNSTNCQALRTTYQNFVLSQIGPSVDVKGVPEYEDQLAVCLKPRRVKDDSRSLVLPVFTFPDQTIYGDVVDLPSGVRSVIAKLGEFGSSLASIDVVDGGNGYDEKNPPKVMITGGGGSKAAAHVMIKGGKVSGVAIERAGVDYTSPPAITIDSAGVSGSGALAEAKLTKRRLPWVDADITWTVRMSWKVPMDDPHIARPLELSAVREFRLFRTDTRIDKCSVQPENEQPLAVLSRPGRERLEDIDLDEVEWTWVDAVRDRELHHYVYRVVAVPEDTNTFTAQEWFRFAVNIPDSRIAARPETVRMLPMIATDARRLGVYFSDPVVRMNADHLSYRIAKVADDPMLPIKPVAESKTAVPPPYVPQTWEDVFPQATVAVTPVEKWEALLDVRHGQDGIIADRFKECGGDPPVPDGRRGELHIIASRVQGKDLVNPTKAGEPLGNPFFRLHLHVFDEKRLPALAHTAASDPAETEWLQFYPDDLTVSADKAVPSIRVAQAWGNANPDSGNNHVWYRYHFFAPAGDHSAFHLSTFYSRAPELPIDATLRAALAKSWHDFTGRTSDNIELLVEVEEGLAAETYSADDQLNVHLDESLRFVTLRSSSGATPIEVGLP